MNFELTRFEAPTMGEALQQIRDTLGTDALIVSTRRFRRGGVFGVGGHEVVEVFAANTRSRIQNIQRERSSRVRNPEPSPVQEAEPVPSATETAVEGGPEAPAIVSEALGHIRQEIREIMTRPGDKGRPEHPFLRECHDTLLSHEVEPRVTEHILDEVTRLRLPSTYPDPTRVRAVLRAQLARIFVPNGAVDDRGRGKVLFLIGPTGVGKTTTIAKLAAKAKIHERRRIGLVTLDTFRIAGVDQLEKYAQIIGLPLYVATSPAELRASVEELRSRGTDLIFIDSAGRSHRDELKMEELRDFVGAVPDAEVHLVLSTTTHGKTILSVANRFERVGFHKLILTKVDETISFGSLVGSLVSIGKPVSYVTDGQNVPDDIVSSDPERLADLVLKTHAL